LSEYLPHVTALAAVNTLVIAIFVPWVLRTKKEPTAALAWCLVVILMPLFGALLFWEFGYNYVHRRLRARRSHKSAFEREHPPASPQARRGRHALGEDADDLARLALQVDAFPVSRGNAVTLYHDTNKAHSALLQELRSARHHIHLEFFIIRGDDAGRELLALLTDKAKQGIEVRLLVDSMGGRSLQWNLLRPLVQAGGRAARFLPLNPLRSWLHVNLRNHRKIVIVDGGAAYTGGMNVGDEYLGRSPRFGYWRDSFLRVAGPAVAGFQRVFAVDWDFATSEALNDPRYFPEPATVGEDVVQVVASGPDQPVNAIRTLFFAAVLSARKRLRIASPYFIPDAGLLDALHLARLRGVEIELLGLMRPDHFLSFHATRYYWTDMLGAGARIYEYARGMMHSKVLLVDDRWAITGSANFDNRSLRLNYEAGCVVYSPRLIAELDTAFDADLRESQALDAVAFARRPFRQHLAENACRLLSPIL
jgi:cardiolipin synthase